MFLFLIRAPISSRWFDMEALKLLGQVPEVKDTLEEVESLARTNINLTLNALDKAVTPKVK